jgi:hypothetical protein
VQKHPNFKNLPFCKRKASQNYSLNSLGKKHLSFKKFHFCTEFPHEIAASQLSTFTENCTTSFQTLPTAIEQAFDCHKKASHQALSYH